MPVGGFFTITAANRVTTSSTAGANYNLIIKLYTKKLNSHNIALDWLTNPQFRREREGLEVPVRPDFFPNGPHQSEIFHHEKSCHEEILPEGINWVENIQLFTNNEPCTHSGRFALNYANAMAQLRTDNGHLVLVEEFFIGMCPSRDPRDWPRAILRANTSRQWTDGRICFAALQSGLGNPQGWDFLMMMRECAIHASSYLTI